MQKVEWEVPVKVVDTCLAKGQNENDCRNYVTILHEFKNKLFACGTNAYSPVCTWRNVNTLNLIKEENSVGKSPFNPHANITTLTTADGKLFIGSTINFSGTDSAIVRADLSIENSKILRTIQYNEREFIEPQFVGSFEHGDFIYFVFRELSIEASSFGSKAIYSRIGRVCKNDAGELMLVIIIYYIKSKKHIFNPQ
jgi:chondroitin sulfate proteoglycan 4